MNTVELVEKLELAKAEVNVLQFEVKQAKSIEKKIEREEIRKHNLRGYTSESYNKLRDENIELRGLIATIDWANGETYSKLGIKLNVCNTRAKELVDRFINRNAETK